MVALNEQEKRVVDLFQQLPPDRRSTVLLEMIGRDPIAWSRHQTFGEAQLRRLASERGQNWDQLNDEQRQNFVCDLMGEKTP